MINRITVIGAGTMGHAIANVHAMNGFKVNLYETSHSVRSSVMERIEEELVFMEQEGYIESSVVKKTLENITLFSDMRLAVEEADYVIEATPEILSLKQELFVVLDKFCDEKTIFASNTSSLSLFDMVKDLPKSRRERTLISHWYNPGHLIPMVELSMFGDTIQSVFDEVFMLHIKSGKKPVKVLKDVPGLIANRMLHALAREVFFLMESGVASPEDIDQALKFGPGFRSATTGMLEVADMGGLDIWCTVQDNLFKELNNSDKACEMLRSKVSSGNLGVKSGEGFFKYQNGNAQEMVHQFHKRLIHQLAASKLY